MRNKPWLVSERRGCRLVFTASQTTFFIFQKATTLAESVKSTDSCHRAGATNREGSQSSRQKVVRPEHKKTPCPSLLVSPISFDGCLERSVSSNFLSLAENSPSPFSYE